MKRANKLMNYCNINPISRQSFYGLIILSSLTYSIYKIYQPSYFPYHIILTCLWGLFTHLFAEYINIYLSFWFYLRKYVKLIVFSTLVLLSIKYMIVKLLFLSFLSARLLSFIVQVRRRKSIRTIIVNGSYEINGKTKYKYANKLLNIYNKLISFIMGIYKSISDFLISLFVTKKTSSINIETVSEKKNNSEISNSSLVESRISNKTRDNKIIKTLSNKIINNPVRASSKDSHELTTSSRIPENGNNKINFVKSSNINNKEIINKIEENVNMKPVNKRMLSNNFDDIASRITRKVKYNTHSDTFVNDNKVIKNHDIDDKIAFDRPLIQRNRGAKRLLINKDNNSNEETFSIDPNVMAIPTKRRIVEFSNDNVLDRQATSSVMSTIALPPAASATIDSTIPTNNFNIPISVSNSLNTHTENNFFSTIPPISTTNTEVNKYVENIKPNPNTIVSSPTSSNISASLTKAISSIGKPPPSPNINLSAKKPEIPFGIAFQTKPATDKKLSFDLSDSKIGDFNRSDSQIQTQSQILSNTTSDHYNVNTNSNNGFQFNVPSTNAPSTLSNLPFKFVDPPVQTGFTDTEFNKQSNQTNLFDNPFSSNSTNNIQNNAANNPIGSNTTVTTGNISNSFTFGSSNNPQTTINNPFTFPSNTQTPATTSNTNATITSNPFAKSNNPANAPFTSIQFTNPLTNTNTFISNSNTQINQNPYAVNSNSQNTPNPFTSFTNPSALNANTTNLLDNPFSPSNVSQTQFNSGGTASNRKKLSARKR